ncbi:hypothetical protein NMG60_11024047 [Bertholletia excelsa]
MEGEKKRKRAEEIDVECDSRGRKEEDELKTEDLSVATPTEEEVDEFFAILRRMHVAVKYFDKNKSDGNRDGRKLTGRWSTASGLEAQSKAGVDGVKAEEDGVNRVHKNVALDLNAVPEAESNINV